MWVIISSLSGFHGKCSHPLSCPPQPFLALRDSDTSCISTPKFAVEKFLGCYRANMLAWCVAIGNRIYDSSALKKLRVTFLYHLEI